MSKFKKVVALIVLMLLVAGLSVWIAQWDILQTCLAQGYAYHSKTGHVLCHHY
jgi:hypothetical protein